MSRVLVSAGIDTPGRPGAHAATYAPYLRRLLRTLAPYQGFDALPFFEYPEGSPDHDTVNYAFKLYGMKEAVRRGYTTLLWSDACVLCLRDPTPVFAEIEAKGYLLVTDGHRLREWASDAMLAWARIPNRDALGETTIAAGGFVGLDLNHVLGRALWTEWWDAYSRQMTSTYWREHAKPEFSAKSVAMWRNDLLLSERADVLGHLGEEAMWGALAVKYGLQRNTGPWCTQSDGGFFRSTGYDDGKLGAL